MYVDRPEEKRNLQESPKVEDISVKLNHGEESSNQNKIEIIPEEVKQQVRSDGNIK